MAVWTKGFVATRNKSPFFVLGLLQTALNRMIGPWSQVREDNHGLNPDEYVSRHARIDFRPDQKAADLVFTYKGEHRKMTVYFGTDCDRKEYTESSINLLLGCSGHSALYMQTALKALRPLGDVYYLECDSNDDPFTKLDLAPMSYLDACKAKLVHPSCLSLADWLAEFRTGTLAATTELEAFGFTLQDVLRIVELGYDESAAEIKKFMTSERVTAE